MTTISQVVDGSLNASTPFDLVLTSVADGVPVVVIILKTNSDNRTFSVTDDQSNTYTEIKPSSTISNRAVTLFHAVTSGTGTLTITVSSNFGTTASASAFELSDGEIDQSSTNVLISNSTTHPLAAAGEIDVAANSVILGGIVFNANPSTLALPSGYTDELHPNYGVVLSKETVSSLTDEDAEVGSASSRLSAGVIASFADAGGGGDPDPVNVLIRGGAFN